MQVPDTWLFETIKLLAQLGGALLVAWLAVRWALRRYKREKAWEKQLQAYVDIMLALKDIKAVLLSWRAEQLEDFKYTEEAHDKFRQRYVAAYTRLQEQEAVAALLLPVETAASLKAVFDGFSTNSDDEPLWLRYDNHLGILEEVTKDLLGQAQKKLGQF